VKEAFRCTARHKTLALVISIALGTSGTVLAQAVNGTIRGTVPIAAGETIQITGGAGYNRTVTPSSSGQYSVTLPVGAYTVSLLQNGEVVQSHKDVSPVAGGAATADFASSGGPENAQAMTAVNVSATAVPPIDVTTTNQVTTITAKQLEQLPLARTAENIALLSPGATQGASLLANGPLNTPVLSFNGASVVENAYYLDGMNTTDALTGQGGISLPYGAIEQQQTLTSGYGAKYGRSIGGVINQIGKSGSNEWHFGAQATWQPAKLRSDYVNTYWNNPRYAGALASDPTQAYGQMEKYAKGQSSFENIYDAYVSGPLIKDKLFFFLGAEQDDAHYNRIGTLSSPFNTFYTQHSPKLYAKLDWNINDKNILTLTGIQNQNNVRSTAYDYDYANKQNGGFSSLGQSSKNTFKVFVANFTSYITDDLTLNAMLGKMRGQYYTEQPVFPGFDPTLPEIGGAGKQNPALVPPGGVVNSNRNANIPDASHRDTVQNYRLNIDYKLGDHDFQVGIDNMQAWDMDDGETMSGPGYSWLYNKADADKPFSGSLPGPPYVAPPGSVPNGSQGYVVSKYIYLNAASVRVAQRAQYIEDNWQVTPKFLLNLGLRNDQFINYNSAGVPYLRLTKPQWAPRIGFSWDVHGDSSLKVFGNAGRYYLALPAAPALRIGGASTYTNQYFTYSGVDPATGVPLGTIPIPENPVDGVSANNAYGQPLDPHMVTAKNAKAEYSDNFVLGMEQQFDMLGTSWVFGVTGLYDKMNRVLDDWDDSQAMCTAGRAQGLSYLTVLDCDKYVLGGVIINPGVAQTILVNSPSGALKEIAISGEQQGFNQPKRDYYALNFSLEHPWDGKWFGKAVYVFSRNYGNTEGPVDSLNGQGGVSGFSSQWDYATIMEGANGLQPNDQRHALKVYGAYALTPEWTLSGNLLIASGHPKVCLGYYGADESDPTSYAGITSGIYHYCGGKATPPGSTGSTPWTHTLDLTLDYRPKWADHKLKFDLSVFNVFNSQTPTQYSAFYGTIATPNSGYGLVDGYMQPRYARFSVAYDW
jgi:hypothetical protein